MLPLLLHWLLSLDFHKCQQFHTHVHIPHEQLVKIRSLKLLEVAPTFEWVPDHWPIKKCKQSVMAGILKEYRCNTIFVRS